MHFREVSASVGGARTRLLSRAAGASWSALVVCLFVQPAQAQPAVPASQPVVHPGSKAGPAIQRVTDRATGSTTKTLSLLYTGDISGRYAWPGCKKRPADAPNLARLVTAAQALRRQARPRGELEPLFFVGGNLLRPDILGHFVFSEAPQLGGVLGSSLARAGVDAAAPGLFDFGAKPLAIRRLYESFGAAKVPLLAGNIRCNHARKDQASPSPCMYAAPTANKRYLLFERDGVRIAVFALMRGDLQRLVQRRSRKLVTVAPPTRFAAAMVKRLRRQERADLVVLLASLNVESDSPGPVLDLARELGTAGPDVILASTMFERGSPRFYLQQIRRGNRLIVGTDRFGKHLAEIRIQLARQQQRWVVKRMRVSHHEVKKQPEEPWVKSKLKLMMAALCKKVSQPLGRGYIVAPIGYSGFLRYMMDVMRARTHAEVAVINDSAIADTSFPMSGSLTWEKILRAIRSQTDIGYVLIQGSRLEALLKAHVDHDDSGLHVLGLTKAGGLKVNGRKLVAGDTYRLALTGFIASGGDGLLALQPGEKYNSVGMSLREAATRFFEADQEARYDSKLDVNPKQDFPDLSRRWLLHGSIDVGFSLSNVAVRNPRNAIDGSNDLTYSLPLLRRDNVTTLAANVDIGLGASTVDHAFEFDLSLNYGHTWTTTQDNGERTNAESLDRITGSLIYKLLAIRNRLGNEGYIPEPYVEGRFITEFTGSGVCESCTDPDDATYHYFDLGGTAGVGFTLHPLFFVKLGFVMRGELLTPAQANPDIQPKPGIYIGYLLRRWKLLAATSHPLQLESRLDFYFTDLSGDLRRELTVQSKLFFSLTRRISLTINHRLYTFDKRSQPMGIGNDISLGLALVYDFRRQTF